MSRQTGGRSKLNDPSGDQSRGRNREAPVQTDKWKARRRRALSIDTRLAMRVWF